VGLLKNRGDTIDADGRSRTTHPIRRSWARDHREARGGGTQEQRVEIRKYGIREYNLRARNLGMVGFDAMLNRIDPDWREHLGRTA